MSAVHPVDLSDDDDFWDRKPTALECARMDEALRVEQDAAARRKAEESERAKIIFGECLLALIKLGMREGHARSMLGKWRGQAKNDALLRSVVAKASEIGTPDPLGYITKALGAALARSTKAETLAGGRWELVGWEAPRKTTRGLRYKAETRGQVWRDPFGKLCVLEAAAGTPVPALEDDPGVPLNDKA